MSFTARPALLALILSALFTSPAGFAQNQEQEDEQEQSAQLAVQYPVDIQVDNVEIKKMLTEHLPLLAHQKKVVLDDEQIAYLAETTPKAVQNMVRTEGYFNSQVSVQPQGKGYQVRVDLGEQTKIDNVSVALLGDILMDDDLALYYKDAFANWSQPVGDAFKQDNWSSSKASVLSAVTRKKYPLAKLVHTQATINPQTKKAELSVNVESERPIYFGALNISGSQRYDNSVAEGLAQFKTGDAYDLDKLLDYQQALEQDSHYSGASVQADFEQIQDDKVPINVVVSEAKRHKVEAGLRYDSEYGVGGSLGYDYYNLFNRGYIGSVYFDADKYQTSVAVGISQPRQSNGHYWTSNVAYKRDKTQSLETQTISSGLWYVRDSNNIEARYGIEFVGEDTKLPKDNINLGHSYATMLTASWRRQNINTQLRPKNGYYFDGKIGTTLGKMLSSSMMARIYGHAGYFFTPENEKIGTFIARSALGYVYTKDDILGGNVPSSLMFRTGGSTSVRGYELNSIGQNVFYSNTVYPDRAMAVISGEYQYPFKKDWSIAVFHDMGGTARKFQDISWRHGTGLGLRWFSPIAPFSFDIAYGHHDKKLRWHISLGTRF
ncbi:MAG: outer membrane protein assembly factor [Neisseriaceae bacterium]|nr:outer membrane protein assembly factor [Neisseriaceae bacterium]